MKSGHVKRPSPHEVGVRTLKNQTSAVLRRVQRGETMTITDRQRPVAIMIAAGSDNVDAVVQQLCKTGRLAWGGGKPAGCVGPRAVKGPNLAAAVIEDRR